MLSNRSKFNAVSLASLAMLLAAPVLLSSCAAPPPPQAYHNQDGSALVVESLNIGACQMVQPRSAGRQPNLALLAEARQLPRHQTAVVILENYNEPRLGPEFRERAVPLFVGLRGAGYQHIYFLQGRGVTDPEGLITLAKYD